MNARNRIQVFEAYFMDGVYSDPQIVEYVHDNWLPYRAWEQRNHRRDNKEYVLTLKGHIEAAEYRRKT